MNNGDCSIPTTSETVYQTRVMTLETNHSKTHQMQECVDVFQDIVTFYNNVMPSLPEYKWNKNDSVFYNLIQKNFDDILINKTVAKQAYFHVIEMWKSYAENGRQGDKPHLGEHNYIEIPSSNFEIVPNNTGYGIKLRCIPRETEWFGINASPYATEYLRAVTDQDNNKQASLAHIRITDAGDVKLHLTVSWDVDVYNPSAVTNIVGVDIGESVIYAATTISETTDTTESSEKEVNVNNVVMEPGDEFRHYRNTLQSKQKRLQQNNDLRGVKRCRNEREKYTEQVLDTASKRVVEAAQNAAPAVIVMEELTGIRNQLPARIDDWPFASLQNKIEYKANAAGIPVKKINPRNTSRECRKCGCVDAASRNGDDFTCVNCGYEVHADVNGAINIARRFMGK